MRGEPEMSGNGAREATTHVHFQPVGGAAGDMTLASLLHAGAKAEEVRAALCGLGLEFELGVESVQVNGVGALHVKVEYPEEHAHRNFRDIRARISGAPLPERVRERAVRTFRLLAVAEGAVHGRPPEEVTFHEVGATDSIVDIVGSCAALELLGADSVSCSPLPLGGGVVRAAHGPLPLPGPATLELLKGCRTRWVEERAETVTPTGAALMVALTAGEFSEAAPPMTLAATGYGAGTARFESAPNLLRAVVGELESAPTDLTLLAANVDDATGEVLGASVESLLASGARDAWLEPIYMKRGRGAYKLCALVAAEDTERLARSIMRATGSLGVRHHRVGRTVAERRLVEVTLPYGRCRVKVGTLDGEEFILAPEYADALALHHATGVPLRRIYTEAAAEAENHRAPADK